MKKLLLLALIIMLLVSCDIFPPSTNSYSNKILFTSRKSGVYQLYMMNPDGTDIVQITDGRYTHSRGRWSPDVSKIVCRTDEGSSTAGWSMLIIDSNGKNRTLLTWGGQFEWHPSGNKIIYDFMIVAELGFRTTNIYTEIEKDTLIENLFYSSIVNGTPAYSPDGQLIAFSSNREYFSTAVAKSELYIMNSDGSNQNRITFMDTLCTLNPYWADNNMIYFNSAGKICKINLIDSTVNIICESSEYAYVYPRLSPNNDKVIFIARAYDGSTNEYLYISNIDGSNMHALIPDSTVSSCDWSKLKPPTQ